MKYKNTDEMASEFVKDGWSPGLSFSELSVSDADHFGPFVKARMEKGEKFYVMSGNGNLYDGNGKLVCFNIPTNPDLCKEA